MAPNDQSPEPSDDKINGIISELRQFLSEVHEEKPVASEAPASEPLPLSSPMDSFLPPVRPEMPSPISSAPSSSFLDLDSPRSNTNTDLPSDSDFWNGNVLGWPTATDQDSDRIPETNVEPFFVDETPNEKIKEDSLPAPIESIKTSFIEPPLISKEEELEEKHVTDPFAPFAAALSQPSAAPVAPEPPPPPPVVSATVVPVEFSASLPDDNVHADSPFNEEAQIKPDNIIHVACIVPSGQGSKGQMFFNKLREAGQKFKTKLEIEAVFIHDWTVELIDLDAWEKSSLLSGADLMFVIASRVDHEKFLPLMKKGPMGSMPKRLIALEHVGLQSLYADLICQLGSKAHGKG